MQNYNGKKYQGGGIDMATFGELLQELRKDHRLSQKQLADVIAVNNGNRLKLRKQSTSSGY